ncbi:bifunctional phosphopantothenoylcysteine decarboxylase/phosphopantothenate--cysteine ligase CoaBC, partial [Acinetobacter sp. RIT592]
MLKDKTVVIGVCGGIAVYKACDLVSKLKKTGVNVHVIMTKSATEFVAPLTFQTLSQNYVVEDMFESPKTWDVEHISLAKKADVFVLAPATANVIGKVANGIADDMLTTTIMATKAKVLIAPAMNTNMYENPVVQRNMQTLKDLDYKFVEPESGRLACGDIGSGKLASVDTIFNSIIELLEIKKDLEGTSMIITAGPTVESIDPVRYITNRSTGKMGYAIAKKAIERGADVTLVSGPTNIVPPQNLKKFIQIESAEDMYNAVLENMDENQVIIKSAAVADYRPKEYSDNKIKKSDDDLSIRLDRTKDIALE